MKTSIPPVLIIFVIACFALSPSAQAVSPAPDGGYPGGNTAEGTNALFSLSSGGWNTALGAQALYHNRDGGSNTGTGFQALFSNSFGNGNTAYGAQSLYRNLDGRSNTATGYRALYSNNSSENTANGFNALYSNVRGGGNTATGHRALYHNNAGNGNTATGAAALFNNLGDRNTAIGGEALFSNTGGFYNTAVGDTALRNNTTGNNNTAVGLGALGGYGGNNNVAVGFNAGFFIDGDFNIDIGSGGEFGDSGTIRIGDVQTAAFVAGIYGETTVSTTTLPVIVDENGQLGTAASSERFKTEIKPMSKSSEAILALKPVTFHYKNDKKRTSQFGLIAEEVAAVNPDLVVRDKNGELYTVRYEAVNAMLLNEFLKEHRTVQEQQNEIDALKTELKEQRALIQKVNDKMEIDKRAPQTVLNTLTEGIRYE